MNLKNGISAMIAILVFNAAWVCQTNANDPEEILAHKDVFGELERPPAIFSHDLHMSVYEDQSCGVCHHVLDESSGELIYREGEEFACTQCHGKKANGRSPALREAYHGSCTACHLSETAVDRKAGPVTCGQCHPRH